jgi:hypothetical protein
LLRKGSASRFLLSATAESGFNVQGSNGLGLFNVRHRDVPPLNLEPETLNHAEGDTLNS